MTSMDIGLILIILAIFSIFFFSIEFIKHIRGMNSKLPTFRKAVNSTREDKRRLKRMKLDGVYIGNNPNRKQIFVPTNANHVFVCGTTGSGKTVALSNFIKSGIDNNYPMLIIDGKGDIGNGSLLDITKRLSGDKKVYVINLNDPRKSDKYNPFKNSSPTVIKDMLINLTEWTEEHYKLNVERYLQRLIELMQLADIPLSLKSIVGFIPVENFLKLSAKLGKHDLINKEEHSNNVELTKSSGSIVQGAAARFSVIIESELGCIFDDNGIDIYTALNERATLLFILNPLLYPELSPLIGNLIVIDSKKAVSKIFGSGLGRAFFIMDEINVYASKSLLDLVNKSRSADITCILATQSLSDLDASTSSGEYFKEQIIENCNNYIIMRQNSATNAEQWAKIIGTRQTMDVTYQIKSSNTNATGTGVGSARMVHEFLFHPQIIKDLMQGHSIYINKDNNIKTKVAIFKPF